MTNQYALNILKTAIANRNGSGYSGGCCETNGNGYSGGTLFGSGRIKAARIAAEGKQKPKMTPEEYAVKYAALQAKLNAGEGKIEIKRPTTKAERELGAGKMKTDTITGNEFKKRYDNTIKSRAITAEINQEAIEKALADRKAELIKDNKKGNISKDERCMIACRERNTTRQLSYASRKLGLIGDAKRDWMEKNRGVYRPAHGGPRGPKKTQEVKEAEERQRRAIRRQYTPQQIAEMKEENKRYNARMDDLDPARKVGRRNKPLPLTLAFSQHEQKND
jgi:hypothetical protein